MLEDWYEYLYLLETRYLYADDDTLVDELIFD
jgi:hypothetical protein